MAYPVVNIGGSPNASIEELCYAYTLCTHYAALHAHDLKRLSCSAQHIHEHLAYAVHRL